MNFLDAYFLRATLSPERKTVNEREFLCGNRMTDQRSMHDDRDTDAIRTIYPGKHVAA